MFLKRLLGFSALLILLAGLVAYYLYNKPHEEIGEAKYKVQAAELAKEFSDNEETATKKYVGTNENMIVVEVTGQITQILQDTSGTTLYLETGDPINGVSCVLDKFSKQIKSQFNQGEQIKLKGLITGKLTDIIIDRCVVLQ
ncbi:MAG TPA: hypothetical protein PK006_01615 [Saprospiraceae bacterium]|nr:hypothetical protein [Saprospiraceae bacterium]